MSGKKYFDKRNPKGEVAEWKAELVDRHKQKDALKKIIAAMTIGKDVSSVFAEVTSCSQTADLEVKKLVYLYLINYAKSQPELAILAVNTFVKDSNDTNPMLRALAIRTMGCIRVDRITEYLCDPLEKSMKDTDPYVRKTAAICVAKLHDINPDLAQDRGFLDMLRDMTNDVNPMVVSNAIAALSEIYNLSSDQVLTFTKSTSSYLVAAMEQCTEWGQVYLLECLAKQSFDPGESTEVLLTRVTSRLQHANSAVVLAAVKVVLAHLDGVTNAEKREELLRKLAAPLVTLLSQRAEVQYVALRNINLILQKYPEVLATEARVFFCKYNDPIYVKLEKLEIMVALASEQNTTAVLAELKEYAQEVDVDFVRKSVSSIGQVAIRLEAAAQKCVEALLELVKLKVSYVVQEAVVVIKDIFRRYPNSYESVIVELCAALEVLEEPDAKAAMVWIIGEYAERIDNADELLGYLLDNFLDEPVAVQLQLLTAAVKLFLKKPGQPDAQAMISTVLTAATQQTDNPDLRDRAYLYWRLLSAMPEEAHQVVLADKPAIRETTIKLAPEVRDELLRQLSTLASVYHKLPASFVKVKRAVVHRAEDLEAVRQQRSAEEADDIILPDGVGVTAGSGASGEAGAASGGISGLASSDTAPTATDGAIDLLGGLDDPVDTPAAPAAVDNGLDDLLGGLNDLSVAPAAQAAPVDDLFGLGDLTAASAPAAAAPAASDLPMLLDASAGHGCSVRGKLIKDGAGQYAYRFWLQNSSTAGMSGFHVQFNKNALGVGLAVGDTSIGIGNLTPGQASETQKQVSIMPDKVDPSLGAQLQIALKWTELAAASPFVMIQDSIPADMMSTPQAAASNDDLFGGLL